MFQVINLLNLHNLKLKATLKQQQLVILAWLLEVILVKFELSLRHWFRIGIRAIGPKWLYSTVKRVLNRAGGAASQARAQIYDVNFGLSTRDMHAGNSCRYSCGSNKRLFRYFGLRQDRAG